MAYEIQVSGSFACETFYDAEGEVDGVFDTDADGGVDGVFDTEVDGVLDAELDTEVDGELDGVFDTEDDGELDTSFRTSCVPMSVTIVNVYRLVMALRIVFTVAVFVIVSFAGRSAVARLLYLE